MASGLSQPAPIKKPPRILTWLVAILAILFFVGPLLVGVYTDWRWFGALDYRGVFNKTIIARIILFFIVGLIAAAITALAGRATWQGRPRDREFEDINSPVYHYRRAIERTVGSVLKYLPILVGVVAGMMGQSAWRTVLLFINGKDFGETDAQFGKDLGFYAFDLPFWQLVISVFTLLTALAFVIALVGHYVLGGIRIGNKMAGVEGGISRSARIQLAVTAGIWMLLQVTGYWFERYSLLFNRHDIFTGASFTDINAYLPAKIILLVIGVVVAAALFASVVLKDLRIPGIAVVLMVGSSLVIGNAWPLIIEQFSVQPNRQAKESEYIARNIDATRYAFGLGEDKVTYEENWGTGGEKKDAAKAAASDEATISNIRLLDPEIISPTFTQMQQLRNFYGFPRNLAVDRYEVDGEVRDYVVAARELDPNALQDNQSSWINRHTVYTHGNGIVAAQANKVDEVARDAGSTRGGYPVFTVSDLQSQNKAKEDKDAKELGIKVDEPRVYYGPVIASAKDGLDYAIVGDTGIGPVEYDTDTQTTTYSGKGGVTIGNVFDRTAYALKYQEMNFLLSDRVGENSKVLYDRDPRERVEQVAPWLTTDSTTYPAVIDGRIKWIVDGYTTLSKMPYSENASLTDATQDALNPDGTTQRLINDEVGYIRNSVKATVDAYDGSVELYEFDKNDPVLKAWQDVFPDVVKPESEISDQLREHLRYPQDLFKVQRKLLARYHVSDPNVFFNNDAFWSVPEDPTADDSKQSLDQPPYYVMAADPQTGKPSFQLTTPYRGLERQFLSAHMSVSSDPDNYGDITVRVLPTNTQTQGPKQAQDVMMSSDQVARDRRLWEGTNKLFNGNLLTLPLEDGNVLYVEPIYSQRNNQESAFPKLLRVLVSYRGSVGYAPTISEALSQVGIDPKAAQDIEEVDGSTPDDAEESSEKSDDKAADTKGDSKGDSKDKKSDEGKDGSAPASGSGKEGEAIDAINDALKGIEEARDGSHEEYGRALDELDKAVKEYQKMGN